MLEDLGVEDNELEDPEKEVLPLLNINSEPQDPITQCCWHHKDYPQQEEEDSGTRYRRDDNDKRIYEQPDQ